jgi:hypothetical protein
LKPGATHREAAELLDGKAKRTTAGDWLAGRRHAPQWALDMLADKIQVRASALQRVAIETRKTPKRPGKQAGARNLAIYRQSLTRRP